MEDVFGRAGGRGNGEYSNRERGMGSELLTYHGICFSCAMLGTQNIYVSIGFWYFSNFKEKNGNMAAWYLANAPPKGACMLTRVVVLRLVVNNFKRFHLLACSK